MPEPEKITIALSREEWTRVALALSVAETEHMRTAISNGRERADPKHMDRARTAARLCNIVCEAAGLEDIFRCEVVGDGRS